MSFFPIHRGREMAFAIGVFHEKNFACLDDTDFAIAGSDLHGRVEVNYILTARGTMLIQVIIASGATKNYPGSRNSF